jgi:hypothetical protein
MFKKEFKNGRWDINIDLDENKGLFFGSDLDYEEVIYLENHKYKEGNFVPIGKVRQEECWVKENTRETLVHTFLVYNIKFEIEKYTKNIKLSVTKKPDLVFKNGAGKEVAIEVETGRGFTKHKNRLKEKFQEAKRMYKNRLVIVLTDSNFARQYRLLAPNTKIMTRHHIIKFLQTQFKDKNKI